MYVHSQCIKLHFNKSETTHVRFVLRGVIMTNVKRIVQQAANCRLRSAILDVDHGHTTMERHYGTSTTNTIPYYYYNNNNNNNNNN